jgi:FkbM family methyltransferase
MLINHLLTPFLRLPHFKGKTRIEILLRQLLWTPIRTEVLSGVKMELDPAEWLQMQLLKGNWCEPYTLALYENLLKPGDLFIDVGAHVGFHSLVARQLVGWEGRCICIEPQPYNGHKILANWRANGFSNLSLFCGAAGSQDTLVELNDQSFTDRAILTLLDGGGKNESQKFVVPMLRLDSILQRQNISEVKLLKIDVEGYELEVVKGLGTRITDVQEIIFEVLDKTNPKSIETLIQLLMSEGFNIFNIQGVPWQIGVEIPESNLWASRNHD